MGYIHPINQLAQWDQGKKKVAKKTVPVTVFAVIFFLL